jgi:hypothetical protein
MPKKAHVRRRQRSIALLTRRRPDGVPIGLNMNGPSSTCRIWRKPGRSRSAPAPVQFMLAARFPGQRPAAAHRAILDAAGAGCHLPHARHRRGQAPALYEGRRRKTLPLAGVRCARA